MKGVLCFLHHVRDQHCSGLILIYLGPILRLQVQNDSETEPGATERIVTLTGNKKARDVAYDMIKEVIDEVHIQGVFCLFLYTISFARCVSVYCMEIVTDHNNAPFGLSHKLKPTL
jgi:hypothetical protein